MTQTTWQDQQTAEDHALYVALELSKASWKLGFSDGGARRLLDPPGVGGAWSGQCLRGPSLPLVTTNPSASCCRLASPVLVSDRILSLRRNRSIARGSFRAVHVTGVDASPTSIATCSSRLWASIPT